VPGDSNSLPGFTNHLQEKLNIRHAGSINAANRALFTAGSVVSLGRGKVWSE
jgi:hypothetical protein